MKEKILILGGGVSGKAAALLAEKMEKGRSKRGKAG